MNHVRTIAPLALDSFSPHEVEQCRSYGCLSSLTDAFERRDRAAHPERYVDIVGDLRQAVYALALSRNILPHATEKVHIHVSELAFQSTDWLRNDYLVFRDGAEIEELEIFFDLAYVGVAGAVQANLPFIRRLFQTCRPVRRLSIVATRDLVNLNSAPAIGVPTQKFLHTLLFGSLAFGELSIGDDCLNYELVELVEGAVRKSYLPLRHDSFWAFQGEFSKLTIPHLWVFLDNSGDPLSNDTKFFEDEFPFLWRSATGDYEEYVELFIRKRNYEFFPC